MHRAHHFGDGGQALVDLGQARRAERGHPLGDGARPQRLRAFGELYECLLETSGLRLEGFVDGNVSAIGVIDLEALARRINDGEAREPE